jgi:hypothetical protein
MTPNYICPCCGYRASLTEEMFQTVLSLVADEYRLTPHDVEWASHCQNKMAREARSVVVYYLKLLSGCMNKEINVRFHWGELSSNTTTSFYKIVERYEEDYRFGERLDALGVRINEALAPVLGRSVENISPLRAISA